VRRREVALEAYVLKPRRERFAELLGSLVGSAIVAIAMGMVMCMVNAFAGRPANEIQGAWLVLVGIVGAWAILVPSKLWEGSQGDEVLRRFVLMVLGLGVGALAFVAASWLGADLPYQLNSHGSSFRQPHFYDAVGKPLILAHMAVFGTLFLILRWWRQTNPLRRSRMSLWAVIISGVFAFLVSMLWQYPMPWLLMAAATISVAVQLASPWLPPRARRARV
jgi:hypothetical protein